MDDRASESKPPRTRDGPETLLMRGGQGTNRWVNQIDVGGGKRRKKVGHQVLCGLDISSRAMGMSTSDGAVVEQLCRQSL